MATIVTQSHAPWWGNLAAGVLGTLINNMITDSRQNNQTAKQNALLVEANKINDVNAQTSGFSGNAFNSGTNNLLGDIVNANAPTLADKQAGYNFSNLNNAYQQAGYNNLNYGTPAVNNGLTLNKIMQALANDPTRFRSVNMADMAKLAEPYIAEAQALRDKTERENLANTIYQDGKFSPEQLAMMYLRGLIGDNAYNNINAQYTMTPQQQAELDYKMADLAQRWAIADANLRYNYYNTDTGNAFKYAQLGAEQYGNETNRMKVMNDNYWRGQELAEKAHEFDNPHMTPFTTDTGDKITEGAFNPSTGERVQTNIRAKGVSPKEQQDYELNKKYYELEEKKHNDIVAYNQALMKQLNIGEITIEDDDDGQEYVVLYDKKTGKEVNRYLAPKSKGQMEQVKLALEQYKIEMEQKQNEAANNLKEQELNMRREQGNKINELKERELNETERANRAKENNSRVEFDVKGIDKQLESLYKQLEQYNSPLLADLYSNNMDIRAQKEAIQKQIEELEAKRAEILRTSNNASNNVITVRANGTVELPTVDEPVSSDINSSNNQKMIKVDTERNVTQVGGEPVSGDANSSIESTNGQQTGKTDVAGGNPDGNVNVANKNSKRPPMGVIEQLFNTPWGSGDIQTQVGGQNIPPKNVSQEDYEIMVALYGKSGADEILRRDNAVVVK